MTLKVAALLNTKEQIAIMPAIDLAKRLSAIYEYGPRFLDIEIITSSGPGILNLSTDWEWHIIIDNLEIADDQENPHLVCVPYIKDQQH